MASESKGVSLKPAGDESGDELENEYEARVKKLEEDRQMLLQNKDLLRKKKQKEKEWAEYCRKWTPLIFLAPIFPVIMSIMTIFVGSIVINTALTECVRPLKNYIIGQIFNSYLLLFGYTWMLIGPIRINAFLPIKIFALVFCGWTTIWNLIGTAWVSGASPCLETSPSLYHYSRFQVLQYWFGVVICLLYIAEHFLMKRKAISDREEADVDERIRKLEEEDRKMEAEEAERKARAEERDGPLAVAPGAAKATSSRDIGDGAETKDDPDAPSAADKAKEKELEKEKEKDKDE